MLNTKPIQFLGLSKMPYAARQVDPVAFQTPGKTNGLWTVCSLLVSGHSDVTCWLASMDVKGWSPHSFTMYNTQRHLSPLLLVEDG